MLKNELIFILHKNDTAMITSLSGQCWLSPRRNKLYYKLCQINRATREQVCM